MLELNKLKNARKKYFALMHAAAGTEARHATEFRKLCITNLPLTKALDQLFIDANYQEYKDNFSKILQDFVEDVLEHKQLDDQKAQQLHVTGCETFTNRIQEQIEKLNTHELSQPQDGGGSEETKNDDNLSEETALAQGKLTVKVKQLFAAAEYNTVNMANKIIADLEAFLEDEMSRLTYISLLKKLMPSECQDLKYEAVSQDPHGKNAGIELFEPFTLGATASDLESSPQLQRLTPGQQYKSNFSKNLLYLTKNADGHLIAKNMAQVDASKEKQFMYAKLEEIMLLQSQGCQKIAISFDFKKPGFKKNNGADQKLLASIQNLELLAQLSWQYDLYQTQHDPETSEYKDDFPPNSYIIYKKNLYYKDGCDNLKLLTPAAEPNDVAVANNSIVTTLQQSTQSVLAKLGIATSGFNVHAFKELQLKNSAGNEVIATRAGFKSLQDYAKFNDILVAHFIKHINFEVDFGTKTVNISTDDSQGAAHCLKNARWQEEDLLNLLAWQANNPNGNQDELSNILTSLGIAGELGNSGLYFYDGKFYGPAQPKIIPHQKTREIIDKQALKLDDTDHLTQKQKLANLAVYQAVKDVSCQLKGIYNNSVNKFTVVNDRADNHITQYRTCGTITTVPRA